jgi:DNA-binding transcriptional ArsR family regulator
VVVGGRDEHEELRDQILRVIHDHQATRPGAGMIQASQIAQAMNLPVEQISYHLGVLKEHGYVRLVGRGHSHRSASLLTRGKQRVVEGHRPTAGVPQFYVGAIIQAMSGGTVQAVGLASQTDLSQVVSDTKLLQGQLRELGDRLLEAVRADLPSARLTEYTRAREALREELWSRRPDPALVKRLLGTLAFLGDIEGTLGLSLRAWPYVSSFLALATKLADALPG